MKNYSLMIALMLGILLSALTPMTNLATVYAQAPECRDALGNVIPCPPSDDKNKKTPTPTPLPIVANPTASSELAGSSWSGTCGLTDAKCPLVFASACSHVGGTWEIESTSKTDVTLKCTVKLILDPTPLPIAAITQEVEPTPLPIGIPNEDGATEDGWSGSCANAGPVNDPCLLKLIGSCFDSNGSSTIGDADEKGTVTVTCTLPLILEPTPLPIAAGPTSTPLSEEGHIGQCTEADGDFFECAEKFVCEDGLLVIKVNLYSGNGTVYDFYCYPDKSDLPLAAPVPTEPGSGFPDWFPWLSGGLLGLLIGMLLPAVQKVRDLAPRAGQTREHVLLNKEDDGNIEPEQAGIPNLTDKPDGGSTEHKDWIHIQSMSHDPDSGASSGAMPQTKEHVLLNKDNEPQADEKPTIKNQEEDGSTEAGYMKLGDIKGEATEPSETYKLKDVIVSSATDNPTGETDPNNPDEGEAFTRFNKRPKRHE